LYSGEGGVIDISQMTSRPRLISGSIMGGFPYPISNAGPASLRGLHIPFDAFGLPEPSKI
jgi:hypothetical protein